ncbi:MAG: TonB-dependent receptor, partial [Lutibacter sp.]
TFTRSIRNNGVTYFANLLGVNALHQGVEFDFNYQPSDKLTIIGMLSLGDWKWNNNVENVQVYDDAQNPIGNPYNLFIEGLKVSDAAQTTAALGFDYELMPKAHFTVDYNYYADLYADYNPDSRTTPGTPQPWKVPDYGTFDASVRYGFKIGDLDTTLIARMNNVFDTEYVADALDGQTNDADSALVWFGFGRTFNISAKIKF